MFFSGKRNHEYIRMLNHISSLDNWHSVHKAANVDEAYDNFCDVFL